MNLQLMWTIHTLPLWFLVFSLLLPRLALLVYWLQNEVTPFHVNGWIPLAAGIVLPRALVMYLIYVDQGLSLWLLVHAVVALVVWSASGRASTRIRRN
ncbi:MAG TPA: hypothetical protein VHU44_18360 [Acidobacteriaceae bacterium]|jgi:hypothetical protein|nr:hypothetical protein [Acidobacteriaceae bacterium]